MTSSASRQRGHIGDIIDDKSVERLVAVRSGDLALTACLGLLAPFSCCCCWRSVDAAAAVIVAERRRSSGVDREPVLGDCWLL